MKRRWLEALAIFAVATALGIFFTTQLQIYSAVTGEPMGFLDSLRMQIVPWYAWAVLTPIIFWMGETFRISRERWLLNLLILAFFGIPIVLIKMFMQYPIIPLISADLLDAEWYTWHHWRQVTVGSFHMNYIYFWMIAGLNHGFFYYNRYRESELQASLLEARLSQAHLQMLRMQLNPHFLFNTLNAVSTLMHRDVEAADQMISQLSDLLRMSLDSDTSQEIPLKQEIEILERYLAIEQTRFADRLTVDFSVDPDTLDALVPSMFLQPIVENAVRHGIATMAGNGHIKVTTERKLSQLFLRIADNGAGFASNQIVREGVGLANTRTRLEQMYGIGQRLEIFSSPASGTTVEITLPFRMTDESHTDGVFAEPVTEAGAKANRLPVEQWKS